MVYSARESHVSDSQPPASSRAYTREAERVPILGELHGEVMVFGGNPRVSHDAGGRGR